MPGQHALLSPSSAHQWLYCKASPLMESKIDQGEPENNEFAEEGTAAHDIAARCLGKNTWPSKYLGEKVEVEREDETTTEIEVTQEMADALKVYVEQCRFIENQYQGESYIESKIKFDKFVPDGEGTCDFFTFGDKPDKDGKVWLGIVDLKYGQGVDVTAEDNPQIRLYALGVLETFDWILDGSITDVRMVIIQPRTHSGEVYTEECMSVKDLYAWAEEVVKPAAARAMVVYDTDEHAPEDFTPGEKQCRFCLAAGECKARAEHELSIAMEGFDAIPEPGHKVARQLRDPGKLSNDDLAGIIPYLPNLAKWVGEVKEVVMSRLLEGEVIPGYKIVPGKRGARFWTIDDAELAKKCRDAKVKAEHLWLKKPRSPAQLEKLIGKEHSIIKNYTAQNEGNPTYAPITDKREDISADVSVDAVEGFENEE